MYSAAQVAVMLEGEVVLNWAFGTEPGFSETSPMLWMSAGKPLTAVLVMQQVQGGRLSLSDPVADVLPAFGAKGKEGIALEHLLTHTGGFRGADLHLKEKSFEEMVDIVCRSRPEPRWAPGQKAGYHTNSSWILLAAMVETVTGRSFPDLFHEVFVERGGLSSVRCRRDQAAEVVHVYDTSGHTAETHPRFTDRFFQTLRPGSNVSGSALDLARFYDLLLRDPNTLGLETETRDLLVSRRRRGMDDVTFRAPMDWGLGVILNSFHRGGETIPYGFGAQASKNTFGHGGSQCAIGFADPEHALSAVVLWNDMPGEPTHQARNRETCEAIYREFLG